MPESLAQVYSSKSDEELLSLAADPDSLADEARPLLAAELLRRNLAAPSPAPAVVNRTPDFPDTKLGKFLSSVGAYLLSLAIAIFGTYAIATEISAPMGHARSLAGYEAQHLYLGIMVAALLGFFVSWYRPSKLAVWVWIFPVALLLYRVFLYSTTRVTSKFGDSIWQHFLAPNCLEHIAACRDFSGLTIPAAQTVAYSVAAWTSLQFVPRTSVKASEQQ